MYRYISCIYIVLQTHQVYNKNGRIGIYTPTERAAIIQKFTAKRARRVWHKKIRYNCRKNQADHRMRVKGRFVKRSVIEVVEHALTGTSNDLERLYPMEVVEHAPFITGTSDDLERLYPMEQRRRRR